MLIIATATQKSEKEKKSLTRQIPRMSPLLDCNFHYIYCTVHQRKVKQIDEIYYKYYTVLYLETQSFLFGRVVGVVDYLLQPSFIGPQPKECNLQW